MNAEFTAVIQNLIAKQGKEVLLNAAKCKAFLADYARNDFKKERRLLLQALDAGAGKAIYEADKDELAGCMKVQARVLHED